MRKCWILLVVVVVGTMLVTACGKKQPRNQAEAMTELDRIKREAESDGGEIKLTAAEKKQAEEEFVKQRAQYPEEISDEQIRNLVESEIRAKKATAAMEALRQDPEYKATQAQMKDYMPDDVKQNRCYHTVNRIDSWKRNAVRTPECKAAADKEKFVLDDAKVRLAKRNPQCLSGGTYEIGKIGEEARCTKHGTAKESKPSFD